uniref:Uncharacterized protein n=1 Tax=Streptomyces avermitilis TaxID=33903 RepID=A0A499VBZ3_STRAX|nr:hypothetical protein SAVMC3_44530 [Streptomyces avermitilis]
MTQLGDHGDRGGRRDRRSRGDRGERGERGEPDRAAPAPSLREALHAALREAVRGEVAFDATARALTTMDASNYRRVPSGWWPP